MVAIYKRTISRRAIRLLMLKRAIRKTNLFPRLDKSQNFYYICFKAYHEKLYLGSNRTERYISACATMQSDFGLHYPLKETLDTADYDGVQTLSWLCWYADNLDLRCIMPKKNIFSAWRGPSTKR